MQPIDSSLKAATAAKWPSIGRTSGYTPVPRRKSSFLVAVSNQKQHRISQSTLFGRRGTVMARSGGLAELDLASLADEELQELITSATHILEQRVQERIEAILPLARQTGFQLTLSKLQAGEVTGRERRTSRTQGRDRRGAIAPKYRNPANPAETWSGRGRKPTWLEQQLTAGRQLSEFAIANT
jgi:DNA-binding protein H-NS